MDDFSDAARPIRWAFVGRWYRRERSYLAGDCAAMVLSARTRTRPASRVAQLWLKGGCLSCRRMPAPCNPCKSTLLNVMKRGPTGDKVGLSMQSAPGGPTPCCTSDWTCRARGSMYMCSMRKGELSRSWPFTQTPTLCAPSPLSPQPSPPLRGGHRDMRSALPSHKRAPPRERS